MTRPPSSTLKSTSKPVLKNPLRASTMPLLAPAAALSGASESSDGDTGAARRRGLRAAAADKRVQRLAADADQQAQAPPPRRDDPRVRGDRPRARPLDDRTGSRRRLHRVRREDAQRVLLRLPELAQSGRYQYTAASLACYPTGPPARSSGWPGPWPICAAATGQVRTMSTGRPDGGWGQRCSHLRSPNHERGVASPRTRTVRFLWGRRRAGT
jgi:hypothetical protein